MVNVIVTVAESPIRTERRFALELTVSQLKDKLEVISGVSALQMRLELFSNDNRFMGLIEGDEKMLGYFSIGEMFRINVINTDPYRIKNEFSDVSRVEKFELDEKEYDKRTDSVRDFLRRNKMGKYAEKTEEEKRAEEELENQTTDITAGQRCQVDIEEGCMKRLGSVKYVGKTDFKPGLWIGVEYDEPVGKHDGSVDGKRYFEAKMKHGAFLRPDRVIVGDFPEEDLFGDDDIDEM